MSASGFSSRYKLFIQKKILIGLFNISLAASAQQTTLSVSGPLDRDVQPVVASKEILGQRDATAVAELTAYEGAIGALAWNGMAASGTITYAESSTPLRATLLMLPRNRVKFDFTESSGHNGWVYSGWRSAEIEGDVKTVSMSARSSAVGFAPFDLPMMATDTESKDSIIDQGMVSVDGQTLHKVRIEVPIPTIRMKLSHDTVDRASIDAYFDPATHLLMKTAAWVALPGTNHMVLFRVTTYSDYQKFSEMLLPATIAETVNGQAIWKLILNTIDLKNVPAAETFTFWK